MFDRKFVYCFAAAAACLLLAGCAGTARGVKQSVYQPDGSLSVVDISRSEADAMVVIRYPAMVREDALPEYYRAFRRHPVGGRIDEETLASAQPDRVADSVVAKSNFYAMSLYRELARDLPRDSVLLSPHAIELDENGRLSSQPLLATEQVPSVVTIDFSVYSFPDTRKMMDSPPLTFGDIVTPLFVIHANRWVRPSTNGLLLSSEVLVGASWLLSGEQADARVQASLDRVSAPTRPLDFVRYLDRGDLAYTDLPLKSPGESRREVVAVEVHPLEKIRMDPDLMVRLQDGTGVDPFAEEFVRGAATRIVQALNVADHDRATFFDRQAALAVFDPELSLAFLARSGAEDVRARLQMAEALLRAERTFLSVQSAALYEGTFEGVYGDQMRQIIAAEYRMLEERRSLARAQNWSTALAVVAMAGAAYAGSHYDSNFFETPTFENIALITSLWAVNNAMVKNAQSKTVGQNFLAQMAPAINRQVSVQVEWMNSTEEITASDFDEFRASTLALYQQSVRAIASRGDAGCAFGHPAIDAPGTWFGPCADGLAAGRGYGVAIDGQGNTIEYLGKASEGRAQGTGAMIFRPAGGEQPVYYEGSFAAGVPHGVVRVEQASRKARVRKFQEGVDRGSADDDQLQRLIF